MKKFRAWVREVHVQVVEVEANDTQDAVRRIQKCRGEYVENSLEYSHTLNPSTWTVMEVNDEQESPAE